MRNDRFNLEINFATVLPSPPFPLHTYNIVGLMVIIKGKVGRMEFSTPEIGLKKILNVSFICC